MRHRFSRIGAAAAADRVAGNGARDPHGGGPAAGPTVVMVAYRMSSVTMADEVVHLEAGRVVDRGTHAELLDRDPGYRELASA